MKLVFVNASKILSKTNIRISLNENKTSKIGKKFIISLLHMTTINSRNRTGSSFFKLMMRLGSICVD